MASQGLCPGKPVDPDGWTSAAVGNGGDTHVPVRDTLWCGTPDGPVEDPLDPPAGGKCSEPFPEGIAIKCASTPAPVCGCDGWTYRNGCCAMGAGHTWVKSEGACPGQPCVEE